MNFFQIATYVLAVFTSLLCTIVLFRGYLRSRVRLVLWCAIAFVAFTINNVLLFVDVTLIPQMDLRLLRLLTSFAGVVFLLYAFIWESDSDF